MSKAEDIIRERLEGRQPDTAVILGSSLGEVAGAVEDAVEIPYEDLPGFPVPKVSGHSGRLVAGRLGGREAIVLQGRLHYYETGDVDAMRPVILAMNAVGVRNLVLTNAAGSLDPDIPAGRLMLITDHINLMGLNPLVGASGDGGFVEMTHAYDARLADAMRTAARDRNIELSEGTYMWFSGPSFETPAEIRAARTLGADAVGMSTVPEVILARWRQMDVTAVSAITNLAAGIGGASPSHEETKAVGTRFTVPLTRLLQRFMEIA